MRRIEELVRHGASITGAEGGAEGETKIDVTKLNNNVHFHIAEVDENGAVTCDEKKRLNRLNIEDSGTRGVHVFIGSHGGDDLSPGTKKVYKVGESTITIEGTAEDGVIFNDQKVENEKDLDQKESILYPKKQF